MSLRRILFTALLFSSLPIHANNSVISCDEINGKWKVTTPILGEEIISAVYTSDGSVQFIMWPFPLKGSCKDRVIKVKSQIFSGPPSQSQEITYTGQIYKDKIQLERDSDADLLTFQKR